jgi:hypothetical protein
MKKMREEEAIRFIKNTSSRERTMHEDLEFSPETLQQLAEEVENLRFGSIMNVDTAGADPMAEEHFLLAVAALEQAKIHLRLARLHQVRALAGGR